ncbi:MAG: DUF1643 domain-containing protein [Boseongicola sp. SB0664_bin_43]|uniref:DUF1643 domain-containing protein n=1 Tax=Boseongicola sp. SB0664_bin_43 TaxID=2604844 RepID=A0A6B0XZG7_9RHOB|nr:DUF1643 domain-containing protein [Boseongicola sp. SB0664_bin_43]
MNLVTRRHEDGRQVSEAVYSKCRKYRYSLTRVRDHDDRRLLYIMLNPSTATELANDPTIERCERRARMLGYGGFRVCNLFALRETDPLQLIRAPTPEGPDNTEQILAAIDWADDILCAWGIHGAHRRQGRSVLELLLASSKPVLALGVTGSGHPRHPLYVPYRSRPKPWREHAGRGQGGSWQSVPLR